MILPASGIEPAQLRSAIRTGAARARKSKVVVMDVRVAPEYDASLANPMVRGEA
jgi:hypothetical protein